MCSCDLGNLACYLRRVAMHSMQNKVHSLTTLAYHCKITDMAASLLLILSSTGQSSGNKHVQSSLMIQFSSVAQFDSRPRTTLLQTILHCTWAASRLIDLVWACRSVAKQLIILACWHPRALLTSSSPPTSSCCSSCTCQPSSSQARFCRTLYCLLASCLCVNNKVRHSQTTLS